jgi:hypothetical protein
LLPERRCDCRRHIAYIHLVQRVPIALEHFGLVPVETEYVISVGRLHHPQQRLQVEAVRHHDQLLNPPLELEHLERVGRREEANPSR